VGIKDEADIISMKHVRISVRIKIGGLSIKLLVAIQK
jgi:hypothetical protein